MKNKSMGLKILIIGLLYLLFLFLFFLFVYGIDFFEGSLFLGIGFGILIVIVARSETIKKTLGCIGFGVLISLVIQIIFHFSNTPYRIIEFIFRNDETITNLGHLTVNELIGYNWGIILFFWPTMLITVGISTGVFLVVRIIKKRKEPYRLQENGQAATDSNNLIDDSDVL